MMRGNRGDEQRVSLSPTTPMKKEAAALPKEEVWEVRPGGMLVQKRGPDADGHPPPGGAPVPTIRVKVKFNGVYHEVYVSAQASFGDLKKLLSEKTGLHPDDQKVVYRDKERHSRAFLDVAGVRDRSKMAMLEDPAAKAKRLLDERRTSKADRAAKAVARVKLDVDKLATKVSALETVVGKQGGRVADADVVALTEALMNEMVRLDAVAAAAAAGGPEVKEARREQEKRVQKLVETLDGIRAKNSKAAAKPSSGNSNKARPPRPPPAAAANQQQQQQQRRRQFQPAAHTTATAPVPQTQTASWETFDLLSAVPPSTPAAPVTTTMAPATTTTPTPRFEWELF